MRLAYTCGIILTVFTVCCSADDAWETIRVHDQFHAEGASAGDLNGDGDIDVVAGPLCFLGPDFKQSFPIAEPKTFPISGYSDQFFSHVLDADGDGASDVLVIGFPGQAARLYINPGHDSLQNSNKQAYWKMHPVADVVDNESPRIVDLVTGGLPEIVCGRGGQYGFYQAGDDATSPWQWTAISRPGTCGGRFAHGLGVGDVNGDGRPDVLDRSEWWEHPAELGSDSLWTQHRWADAPIGGGGAQMHTYDFDGDGDNDILTSLNAHGWGLAWFEQVADQKFVRHNIMGQSSTDNDHGVAFSQLHAVALVDIDGDGLRDIVTGKRWMAHNGKDTGGLQAPVLYWFQTVRDGKSVRFVPRQIDDDSGVGTDVLVHDLNQDGRPDVVTCSKKGLIIHLQQSDVVAFEPLPWKQTVGRDQSKYADGFSPQQAADNMLVADGFHVDTIASEPELTQPVAMCFDARGRIWVVEGHTYPTKAPNGEGRDRIVIFSDEDSDGKFETKTTFIEGLNLASGIEVGFGGVWVGAAPELLFIPDADHDDRPDGPAQVMLEGWGYQDTHETLNSLTWGPDGWLYGCQGVFTHSNVRRPNDPEGVSTPMNAGVWRFHPVDHRFEVFAHGTSNPWGVDFNDQGEWFISACVIPHLYHVQQGGRYQRQAGQHFNPYTFDDLKTIADHAHYTGSIREHAFWGENSINKPAAAIGTSQLGGGHAHCGLAIYNGGVFPADYHGDLFFHNLHGHRVVRESLTPDGSGYVGQHRPDFALARDHKQIGVGVMVGPDGALYTSDWHDIQTCHNRTPEVWDRTDGRLFRIRYGAVRPQSFDLWTESDQQLAQRLSSPNGFFARQARLILHHRAATGTLDSKTAAAKLSTLFESAETSKLRLKALWTQWCVGALSQQDLVELVSHDDVWVRAWAYHFIGESFSLDATGTPDDNTDGVATAFRPLFEKGMMDVSAVGRRYIASLLQRLPPVARWATIEKLSRVGMDSRDRNLPLLLWYALEPLVPQNPSRAYGIAKRAQLPNLLAFTIRRLSETPAGRDFLAMHLSRAPADAQAPMILEQLSAVATRRGGVEIPEGWRQAYESLSESDNARSRELARSFAVQIGDQSILPYFRERLLDPSLTKPQRIAALKILQSSNDLELPKIAFALLDDASIRESVVAALAQFNDPKTPGEVLARFKSFDDATQSAALGTLVARESWTEKLVSAMESGRVSSADVPAYIVQQALRLGNADLNRRLGEVWGRIGESSEEKAEAYATYRALLTPKRIAAANAHRGRVLYEANCGKCHKLFGTGGAIGPGITGADRTKVDYWLENILEPSSLIGKAYQVSNFITDDGRVVSGFVLNENEDAVTVQTATDQVILSKDSIEQSKLSDVSLMPDGQLQTLSNQDALNLFKYLMSPQQVSLSDPATRWVANRNRSPAGAVIEAETLTGISVSDGVAQPQAMSGFGPHWSGNQQLWWTGAKPDGKMTFSVQPKRAGTFDVVVYFTQAVDYAEVEVSLEGAGSLKRDFYDPRVSLGDPVIWEGVEMKPGGELEFEVRIHGANDLAKPSFMVGIDSIELNPAR